MTNVFDDSVSKHVQKLARGRGDMQHEYPHLRDLRPDITPFDASLKQHSGLTVRLNPKELPKTEQKK